ncbi:MAG: histidine kinase [Bacteroidales bacterium]|nr:histidine kinase [Bacteroidales bacterium]
MNRIFFSQGIITVLLHLLVILLVLFLPFLLMSGTIESAGNFLGRFYLRVGLYGVFFYLCYLYLVPEFYLRGRWILFVSLVVLVTALIYLTDHYLSGALFPDDQFRLVMETVMAVLSERGIYVKPPSREFHAVGFITVNLLLAGSALGLRLAKELTNKEKLRKELEKQHISTELAMLKNQVSPHFFFNTLNNIYSLTEIDASASQQAILKLSRLMRYLLYETNSDRVMLKKELAFLADYIDLMRLRLTEKVDVSVSFPQDCGSVQVPPLLFLPFVENAFKHGISYRETSFIHMALECSSGAIHFRCANSMVSKTDRVEKAAQGGLGLENVRKRLSLLYSQGYNLDISHSDTEFVVSLIIHTESNPS